MKKSLTSLRVALKKKQEDALRELESLKMEVFAQEIQATGAEKLQVGAARMRNGTSSGEIPEYR
ncbi:MAG: hypothetical protein IPP49_12170 [Saprospiraceae bacterium]|nr:hypothetical protein [Saprospiraceae bacterium]